MKNSENYKENVILYKALSMQKNGIDKCKSMLKINRTWLIYLELGRMFDSIIFLLLFFSSSLLLVYTILCPVCY